MYGNGLLDASEAYWLRVSNRAGHS